MRAGRIAVLLTAAVLTSCAAKELEREVDLEVAAQPAEVAEHGAVTIGLEKIMSSPNLDDSQKDELAGLLKMMMLESMAIQEQTSRLKSVLFDTVVAVPYRKEKVEEIRRRLVKLNDRKMAIMSIALVRAEKIVGYLPPEEKHHFFKQLLLRQYAH